MRARFQPYQRDLLVALGLLLLPLGWFWSVTLGDRTLLPADNLTTFEPWQSAAVTLPQPHNPLLSDLVLENYAWKKFILDSLHAGEIPLWNPYQFAGIPFLAAGQHSALYPFSIIFYLLPLPRAYGVFTVSQFFLAGLFAYLFLRGRNLSRLGAAIGAIVYELSLFMVVSVVFTMIIAGVAWLPLVLWAIDGLLQQRPALGGRPATAPWLVLGAGALGVQVLAGHVEITYYTLLIAGVYTAWGLAQLYFQQPAQVLRRAVAAGLMALFGITLGAIQLVPLYELVRNNFRSGSATFEQIISWAYPWRHLIAFFIPNFYGNPSHHTYFDLFTWQTVVAPLNNHTIDWGIKNYVEGGAYVGLLPLFLSAIAIWQWLKSFLNTQDSKLNTQSRLSFPFSFLSSLLSHPATFFILLAFFSLAFVFPTRLYALIFWLPGINQLHSPFRWIWPFTFCIAVLSAYGAHALQRTSPLSPERRFRVQEKGLGHAVFSLLPSLFGLLLLLALLVIWQGYDALHLAPFFDRLVQDLALASQAFGDGRMFFSYEARWLVILALTLIASGGALHLSRYSVRVAGRPLWEFVAVGVVVLDLGLAGWGFNPAADAKLLDYTPPSVEFLRQDVGLWRYTTYDPHGAKPFNANVGWFFNLQDIRGYDSIFTKQYKEYMELIQPQYELDYNRIAPISDPLALDSPLLDLLNVKYVISVDEIVNPKYTLVYSAEVKIYRNETVVARAYWRPLSATLATDRFSDTIQNRDPRQYTLIAPSPAFALSDPFPAWPTPIADDQITYTLNEVSLHVAPTEPAWLVLADSYFPGWKAFVRPVGGSEQTEKEVGVMLVNGNFRGVLLEPGEWTVRFKYSPLSVKLGGILSLTAGMTLVFLLGVYAWRYFYQESEVNSTARRVAKNSLAPMALNLFNRAIDLAFAAFMLRVLGPGDAGKYYFAIVIFGWFEIITNYGLNTLLTRDVARDREHANRYLANTTILRLALGLGAIPALAALLAARQSLAFEPLTADTLWAIGLLVLAQFPASFSTGLAALFYAYEKAEYPAAVATVSTLIKVSLGTVALVLGWGFVGLAGVSAVVNLATLGLLGALTWRLFFRPRFEFDPDFQKHALRESFPLMLNNLLATLFFKVDVTLLEPLRGVAEVGWYSTGYKYLDAYNIVPSLFTFALFPVMSRQAQEASGAGKVALHRSYVLAIKLLVAVALPLAALTTFLAPLMIGVLGGEEFLPHGAVALALMVWSIPFGWINSVTNYVLIALGQQRGLTRAFAVALIFNVIFNLIFIPRYGYAAAALITIASEIFEGAAFYWYTRQSLGAVNWLGILWRLWVSTLAMLGAFYILWPVQPVLALVVGVALYALGVVGLRAFDTNEIQVLRGILPKRK